jgi:cytochrome c5
VSALVAMAEEPSPTSLTPRQARLFSQACAHCHLRPEIEVPVLGVEADWKKRRKRGFESLLSNTINGFGNMPPLGTCGACTESDFRALVSFLALLPEPLSELEGDGDGDGERIGDLEGKESGR